MRFLIAACLGLASSAATWAQPKPENVVVPLSHYGHMDAMAISDGSQLAVTASNDGSVALWNAQTGEFLRSLGRFTYSVTGLAINADGSIVVAGAFDGKLLVWEAATGRLLRTIKTTAVRSVSMSSDAKSAVSLEVDARGKSISAMIWNLERGERIQEVKFESSPGRECSVSMTTDGAVVLTFGTEIKLWNASTGKEISTLTESRRSAAAMAVDSAAISRNGKKVVAFGGARCVWWNLDDGNNSSVERMLPGFDRGACALNGDGSTALTTQSNRFALLAIENARVVHQFDKPNGIASCLALGSDAKRALTSTYPESDKPRPPEVSLWDAENGKKIAQLSNAVSPVEKVRFSTDGTKIDVQTWSNFRVQWDRSGCIAARSVANVDISDGISRVSVTRDGKLRLAIDSEKDKAILTDVTSGKQMQTFQHGQAISCVAIAHDGKSALTAAFDGTVTMWNTETGAKIHTLLGHTDIVSAIDLRADGKRIITGSNDGSARLWDATSGKELIRLYQLDGGNDWFVMTPEGYFDGTPAALKQFKYRIDGKLKLAAFDRFAREFQRPGLLALVWDGKPIK